MRRVTIDLDEQKRAAAARAVELVTSGDGVGLGTGSTAAHATRLLGERLRDGRLRDIVGVPTSDATARIARGSACRSRPLEERSRLDVTIATAPTRSIQLDLIKGLSALLREKIVALASWEVVIVADGTKQVTRLGARGPVRSRSCASAGPARASSSRSWARASCRGSAPTARSS